MARKIFAFLLLIGLFLLPGATVQDKSYVAERFDVNVQAQGDGSLVVEETVDFRFSGGPFTYVFRELPTDHTDGIVEISAGVDSIPWPQGSEAGEIEIEEGNPIRVTWHLPPTFDVTQSFTLRYKPLGVVRRTADADVLDWQALPDDYDYAIGSSRVMISYPLTAELLSDPQVLVGSATVETGDGQAIFDVRNLAPGDPLVVRLSFAPGSLISAPPAWQAREARQRDLMWLWAVAAVLILAGGLAVLWLVYRPYRRSVRESGGLAYHPPSDLAPAQAGILQAGRATTGWQHGLATLFDLAGRGYMTIEEIPTGKWYRSQDFSITRLEAPVSHPAADLRPHEAALLDILFNDKTGPREVIAMSELGRVITSSRWKGYSEALLDEMRAADLLSPKREAFGVRLIAVGVTLMFLFLIVLALIFLVFFQMTGPYPVLVAFSLLALGLIWAVAGGTMSQLSDRGAQWAAQWEPYYRYLQQAARGKVEIAEPDKFERDLPFAAAYGLAEPLAKRYRQAGVRAAPAYFHSLQAADGAEMAAMIAVISAASSSGGAAGAAAGAAGAAAAGGGASGAG